MVGRGYTISEFSRLTGMSRTTIRKKITQGEIKSEIDPNGKKWISEEYLFKFYKILDGKPSAESKVAEKEFSLQEALLYITQMIYNINDRTELYYDEINKKINKVFNEKGLLTEKVSKQLVKLIRKQITDDVFKSSMKKSMEELINDPNFKVVLKNAIKQAIKETSDIQRLK